MALLLLRAVLGVAVLAQGASCLGEPDPDLAAWLTGLTALVAGTLLVTGFLTPIAAAIVAAGAVGVRLSLLPACPAALFDSRTAFILALTMLVAILGLGPGAFSVDARMFGRREIIIPPLSDR